MYDTQQKQHKTLEKHSKTNPTADYTFRRWFFESFPTVYSIWQNRATFPVRTRVAFTPARAERYTSSNLPGVRRRDRPCVVSRREVVVFRCFRLN